MVAWLSCGDTSLVTWADSHDARRQKTNKLLAIRTVLIPYIRILFFAVHE